MVFHVSHRIAALRAGLAHDVVSLGGGIEYCCFKAIVADAVLGECVLVGVPMQDVCLPPFAGDARPRGEQNEDLEIFRKTFVEVPGGVDLGDAAVS